MHTLKALNCVSSYFMSFGWQNLFSQIICDSIASVPCAPHLRVLPPTAVVTCCAVVPGRSTSTCCRCASWCLSVPPPRAAATSAVVVGSVVVPARSLRLRCPHAACRCGDARVAVCAPAPPPRAAHMPAAVLPLPLVPLSASAYRPPACRWLCTFVPRLRLRVLPTCLPPCCLCRWPLPCLSHFILRLSTYFAPLNTQHRLLSACCPPSWCCPRYHWRIRASPACLNSMLRLYNTQHRTQVHNTTRACPHACTAAHLRAVVVTPALPFVPRLRVLPTCLSLRCSLI